MNVNLQRRIGFAAWGGLALLQIVWHAWLLPPARMPVVVALVFALLPLALPLSYWRAPARALLLAGMISLFYFCHGIAEAYAAPNERVYAMIEIALAAIVILASARMPKRRGTAESKLPSE
ncbi:MAG: DUF2069 domain-containing protein [Xanthomonadaceae bacterium]|nr:DUF2069 domain-containing protein [Xanthomonadaceae bacterium]MBU6478300.1 DUF2069 domain-containing protein [Xanthomonadaceae bacterium]MDE2053365.1 DUF2069 domain-containing protein [Xanthomonadaceae bacterium]